MKRLNAARIFNELSGGIKKFFKTAGADKAVIGLSGGIDCAVVAAAAVAALGAKNVYGVALPTRFSSRESMELAKKLAKNLGINFRIINIDGAFESLLKEMGGEKKLRKLTAQNLQPRLRANALMAVSNETGGLLLNTGNKTEIAVGYFTLYGDSCGALAPLAELYKEHVYAAAEYINKDKEIIPRGTITRPPTAELARGQKDSDDLPPYKILDKILYYYLDKKLTPAAAAKKSGADISVVKRAEALYKKNLFKQKYLPPAIKISSIH
ncbi:MAG: NAD(+) synthase [Elusimicrobium sp.]|jgi:NAD+ synthase (glutamine-hydrolysing)|nr:NAD(+) synthase [Elusimicrobium sp.]